MSMWLLPVGGALLFIGAFVWSLTRQNHDREIPLHTERRQMLVSREQKDRLGAL